MAWEKRQRGGAYYTRSRREGKRVVRQYLGCGEMAQLCAEIDQMLREGKAEERALRKQRQVIRIHFEELIADLNAMTDQALRAAFQDAGFHQHARGEWRKKRHMEPTTTKPRRLLDDVTPQMLDEISQRALGGDKEAMKQICLWMGLTEEMWEQMGSALFLQTQKLLAEQKARQEVIQRVQNGDTTALPALRRVLDEAPEAVPADLWKSTEQSLVEAICGQNLLHRECLRREMQTLREQLAGPSPSALETLLIERILACHLHILYCETDYSQTLQPHPDWAESEPQQKRLDRAQRRYLSAIKSLAMVRRLQIPAVQVNIGEKQVNLIQGAGTQETIPTLPTPPARGALEAVEQNMEPRMVGDDFHPQSF